MIITRNTLIFVFFFFQFAIRLTTSQDLDNPRSPESNCVGIFISYTFISREKEFPHVKNSTAQPWSFKSIARVLNTGVNELKAWKLFIGFQHEEILVSTDGAVLVDGEDFPSPVGNGTSLSGSSLPDLKTSIDTAGDLTQIQAQVEILGTQFGIKPPGIPMPKTMHLQNDGYKCPTPTHRKSTMYACCVKDPKFKVNKTTTKFLPRQKGDLEISYDVIIAFEGNYQAQVTMENNNPLGRLDHWNLTWEWMRGEFIYTMRGAYTHKFDSSGCLYGPAVNFYQGLDFNQVMNCDKKPVITDMPPEKANDDKVGNLPYCCRNGSLLPKTMNRTKSKAMFQMQVYKIPPDMNRTALYPPERWKIQGFLNPDYKCGPPLRVDPTEFPDTTGLDAVKPAIATWQIVCNITKKKTTQCCVSFSAYYNESVIPCNTCACGCEDSDTESCNPHAHAMLLPAEALLVPFGDRERKAKAWANLKRFHVPRPLPCGDNCGVSINWHINTDYRTGWTARITLFNWQPLNLEDWFLAVQIGKAYKGYENVYSFNGTKIPGLNNTLFFHGLPGLNYLLGETNGSVPKDPKVPGKQQSVVSFKKLHIPGINIAKGDGFPTKVLFNGDECSLPTVFPIAGGSRVSSNGVVLAFVVALVLVFLGVY